MRHTQACYQQLERWARLGPPSQVWMGGLMRPRALLVALRQAAVCQGSRLTTMDSVKINISVRAVAPADWHYALGEGACVDCGCGC